MSYDSVVRKVAEMAWEYPFFTWDEAGAARRVGGGGGVGAWGMLGGFKGRWKERAAASCVVLLVFCGLHVGWN